MGGERENSEIQIWKASQSIFRRLVEQDAGSDFSHRPVVTRRGPSQSGLCSVPPRSQEHACPCSGPGSYHQGTRSVPQPGGRRTAARVCLQRLGATLVGDGCRSGAAASLAAQGLGQLVSPLGASWLVCGREE